MKNVIAFTAVLMLMLFSTMVNGQAVLNLGKCDFKISEIREVPGFKGENGIVKPSRRDAKLLEIKLEGKANSDGASAWYPQMFAAIFYYRGALRITPALAIGMKFKDPLKGENIEQWFNAPGVSFTSKNKEGDPLATYLIVEIAKETNDFILQGPSIITETGLKQ